MHNNHIAILGGTFDPIHNGHIHIANLVLEQLNFKQVTFVLNNTPPHRPAPIANTEHRLNMLKLAIDNNPKFIIDTCELERPGPSYMVDTIEQITLNSQTSLDLICPWLILGKDAFENLPNWHNFKKLIKICNFIVINRSPQTSPPSTPSPQAQAWLSNYLKNNLITLDEFNNLNNTNTYKPNGTVIKFDNNLIPISGTYIRELIKTNKLIKNITEIENSLIKILPNQIVKYILEHDLYI